MKSMRFIVPVVGFLVVSALAGSAAFGAEIEGLFGFSDVEDGAAVAVWIPLDPGQSVAGVRWFNSDGSVEYPALSVVAGDPNWPELVADAVELEVGFTGNDMGWSELAIDPPVASETGGIYIVIQLPAGSSFVAAGHGGGAGFGYVQGHGERRSWSTADGVAWNPFSVDYQVAIDPVMSLNKTAGARILTRPERPSHRDEILKEEESISGVGIEPLAVAPNPLNPETTIRFALAAAGPVVLKIFDVKGALVQTLVDEHLGTGQHRVNWDGRDSRGARVASGIYFARLKSGKTTQATRLVVVK